MPKQAPYVPIDVFEQKNLMIKTHVDGQITAVQNQTEMGDVKIRLHAMEIQMVRMEGLPASISEIKDSLKEMAGNFADKQEEMVSNLAKKHEQIIENFGKKQDELATAITSSNSRIVYIYAFAAGVSAIFALGMGIWALFK